MSAAKLRQSELYTRLIVDQTNVLRSVDNLEDRAQIGHDSESAAGVEAQICSLKSLAREIALALAALEDGTYGTCQGCGRPIDPERLRAQPVAVLCCRCKEAAATRKQHAGLHPCQTAAADTPRDSLVERGTRTISGNAA